MLCGNIPTTKVTVVLLCVELTYLWLQYEIFSISVQLSFGIATTEKGAFATPSEGTIKFRVCEMI